MADDGNHRYRSRNPYGRGAPGGGHSHSPSQPPAQPQGQPSDPLAELARLIGQNDPFAEAGREGMRAPAAREPHPEPAPDWRNGGGRHDPYHPAHASHAAVDPRLGNGGYPPEAYRAGAAGAYARHDPQFDPMAERQDADDYDERAADYERPAHDRFAYGRPGYDGDGTPGYPPPYDEYGAQPQPGPRGYDDPYYRDDPRAAHGEDMYEDVRPARRRGGMMTVLAVLGLAVVGTAAAFGYRAVFGTSTTQPPPVIKAESAPRKVAAAGDSRDAQSGKLIYDRVGNRSQGEKLEPREEQPMETRAAPRVVLPGPTPNNTNGTQTMPASATALAPIAGGATGEPKRIRTVTIRPDQPTVAEVPSARSAPAARVAAASAPVATAEPPAASAPRVVAARPAPPPAAEPAQGTNGGPLSLTPPVAARAAPPPAATPTPMRIAAAPPAGVEGNYTVQVSSQRSEAEAQSSFRTLQAKYPNILGGRQPIIRRADLGDKGIYYRAQVGPFATLDQATELCSSLKAAGGQCVVQRN
jgi:hypothetical protein